MDKIQTNPIGWSDTNQRIILLSGGLANQAVQYIFMRWLEMKTGEPCILDDSELCIQNPVHNGYELGYVWGVRPRLLSQCIPSTIWKNMMTRFQKWNVRIPQQLKEMGYPVTMIEEFNDRNFQGNKVCIPTGQYIPVIAKSYGFLYFNGFFGGFLRNDLQFEILKELQFPPIKDEKNMAYMRRIRNSESVCIHVRRGDFKQLGWIIPTEVYASGVQELEKRETAHLVYFIFSDEIDWCKENQVAMGLGKKDVVFIEGNHGLQAYIDMQLMSMCKHFIKGNSGFSGLATIFRERAGMTVDYTIERDDNGSPIRWKCEIREERPIR